MTWLLAVLKGLLSLADSIAGYLREGQLLEAGRAIESSANLQRALSEVSRANAARDDVARHLATDPLWMPDQDPNRRD